MHLGKWRKKDQVKIAMAKLTVKWEWNSNSTDIIHACPWGMKEFVKRSQTSVNVIASCKVLPMEVRGKLGKILT